MQTDLFEVHRAESNPESQSILNHNRKIFSRDCMKVYNWLMDGRMMTIKEMDVDRSRISDLKRNGVQLSFHLNIDKYKVWYMSKENKEQNKLKFKP